MSMLLLLLLLLLLLYSSEVHVFMILPGSQPSSKTNMEAQKRRCADCCPKN